MFAWIRISQYELISLDSMMKKEFDKNIIFGISVNEYYYILFCHRLETFKNSLSSKQSKGYMKTSPRKRKMNKAQQEQNFHIIDLYRSFEELKTNSNPFANLIWMILEINNGFLSLGKSFD